MRRNTEITIVVGIGLHEGVENLYDQESSYGRVTVGLETSNEVDTILQNARKSGVKKIRLVGGQAEECIHDIAVAAQRIGMQVTVIADKTLVDDGDLGFISPQRQQEKRSFLSKIFAGHRKIKVT